MKSWERTPSWHPRSREAGPRGHTPMVCAPRRGARGPRPLWPLAAKGGAEASSQRKEAAAAPKNTRGAPAARLSPAAQEAFQAHVEAMTLPLAKMVVATLSSSPMGGKKDASAKAVKEVSMLKEVRSMKKRGGARKGCTKQEPEHLETLRQVATAQDTLALTVRAICERMGGGTYRCLPCKPSSVKIFFIFLNFFRKKK
jgi:hypothetical protein